VLLLYKMKVIFNCLCNCNVKKSPQWSTHTQSFQGHHSQLEFLVANAERSLFVEKHAKFESNHKTSLESRLPMSLTLRPDQWNLITKK